MKKQTKYPGAQHKFKKQLVLLSPGWRMSVCKCQQSAEAEERTATYPKAAEDCQG